MPMREEEREREREREQHTDDHQLTRSGHHNHQQNQAYNFYARIDTLQQASGFGRVFGSGRVFRGAQQTRESRFDEAAAAAAQEPPASSPMTMMSTIPIIAESI